jgi:hypothetical protein
MTDPAIITKVVRPRFRSAVEELITKLINGGYLQPALRDDPDAITTAIVRLKEDLRGGSDDGVLGPPSSGLRRASRARIPSSTHRLLAISHATARALGLKAAAVVLPFEQPVGALINPQSVGAMDLGRQASRDLTSEAMKPREAA